jgi:tetratricopeptide (TPR) repeat protein
MNAKRLNIRDILRLREASIFAGREAQRSLFKSNLKIDLEDPRRRFVFSIYGQGGVGKTMLLLRFREIATASGALTACLNEDVQNVVHAMGQLADQFHDQGWPLKRFSMRYKVYCQRQQEIENDPNVPKDSSGLVGQTLSRVGLTITKLSPAAPVANLINEDALAKNMGELSEYVFRKSTSKDKELIQKPIDILTPLLISDINDITEKRTIVLFIDAYERSGIFLDPWLRGIFQDKYGSLPANIVITVAGQNELDRNLWSPFETLIAYIPLEAFTESEARDYLQRKGITDDELTQTLIRRSGGLPLRLAIMAGISLNEPEELDDQNDTAIQRYLKPVNDPRKQQAALDAALPRWLNREIFSQLVEEPAATSLFDWLKTTPFVSKRGQYWVYHPLVREPMLHYKHYDSPTTWSAQHEKLAQYFTSRKKESETEYSDEALAVIYHYICSNPAMYLPKALNGFVSALAKKASFGIRWAETLAQAGEDCESQEVKAWAQILLTGARAWDDDRDSECKTMFDKLIQYPSLQSEERIMVLIQRSHMHRLLSHYNKALADLDEAIKQNPKHKSTLYRRGLVRRDMNHYEKALTDFNRAIRLDRAFKQAIAERAQTYYLMKEYDRAIAGYTRAIKIDPEYAWAITNRGEAYEDSERYNKALADYDQAIKLDPTYHWAYERKGAVLAIIGQYDEAIVYLDKAEENGPTCSACVYSRSLIYIKQNQ